MPVGSLERKNRNFSHLILPHILHLCADTSYCPFNSLSPRLCICLSSTHIFVLEMIHSCFWMFAPFRENPTCPIRCHRSSSVPALFCERRIISADLLTSVFRTSIPIVQIYFKVGSCCNGMHDLFALVHSSLGCVFGTCGLLHSSRTLQQLPLLTIDPSANPPIQELVARL